MRSYNKVIFGLLMSISLSAVAAVCAKPHWHFEQDNLVFQDKGQIQRTYRLHNISHQIILLSATRRPGASAGWDTVINPGKNSVLTLQKEQFAFACKMQTGQSWQTVACQKVLEICELQHAINKNNSNGSYWIYENLSV